MADRPFAEPNHCPKCDSHAPWAPFALEWFPSPSDDELGRLRVTCGRCGYMWWKQTADAPLTPTPEQDAEAEIERLLNGRGP